jgi:ferredoxin
MQIDKDKCVGCANCVPVCPMGAIYIGPEKLAEINEEDCVEHLPPKPVRFLRRCLATVALRFQPEPDICPTEALVPDELEWPRIVRRAFSDPQVPHESTGIHGRGTAEVKTNDVTGRIREGDAGFVIELGRPGVGVYFREVDRVARTLASHGVVFETENPVTSLMVDPAEGRVRKDVLGEKVLSCIIESKISLDKLPEMLGVIRSLAPSLNTVVSIGVSTRCDANGQEPLKELLLSQGVDVWRAKINLGMGRQTNRHASSKERKA